MSSQSLDLVYRVEDAEGFGYKKSLDRSIGSVTYVDYCDYYIRRPLPADDGIDLEALGDNWFFAFESIEQLKQWFLLNERNAGASFGGQILTISVPSEDVVRGGRQVVFDNTRSSVVQIVPLNWYDTESDRMVPFDFD